MFALINEQADLLTQAGTALRRYRAIGDEIINTEGRWRNRQNYMALPLIQLRVYSPW